MPTGIYAPGTGGKGTGLHPVDTRDSNNQNLSRESLVRYFEPRLVTDGLVAHYAARLESFSDGDAVGTLTDQQNANDLTQATSSKKPTFRDNATDNINGNPVVDGDGSDDILENTDAVWADINSLHTAFVVVRPSEVSLRTPAYSLGDPNDLANTTFTANVNDNNLGSGGIRLRVDSFNIEENGSDLTGTPVLYSIVGDEGGDYRVRRDGTQVLSDTSTFTLPDATKISVFARTDDDNQFNGDIAELLIYNRILTDTEISQVEGFLNNLYATF